MLILSSWRASRRVREIYDLRRSQGVALIAVVGDFNDTPDSDPLKPLLSEGSDLQDIFAHPQYRGMLVCPARTAQPAGMAWCMSLLPKASIAQQAYAPRDACLVGLPALAQGIRRHVQRAL